MKLLGWMHRKLRKNSIEPFKDFTIGNSCNCLSAQPSLDDQQYYPKPNYSSRPLTQPQRECQKPFSEIKANRVEEGFGRESPAVISELFHGFLTIGTLGLEPIISEPATPTFPESFKNITEKKTEVTENDLKLINDELEKFLEAEAKEGCNESSGRSSHVSTITLSGKQMEGADAEEYGKMVVCPLQGYLFGSSIELPETIIEVKKEKTSLGELFQRSNIADVHSTVKCEKGEMRAKGTYKFAMHLMKKMLKKLHATSRNSTASAGDDVAYSVLTKRKLHKVLRMFHKKIHPEISTAEKEFSKSQICEIKNTPSNGGYDDTDLTLLDEDNRRFPQGAISKETQCYKTNLSLPQNGLTNSGSSGNREHWIKTDADYLVLEL